MTPRCQSVSLSLIGIIKTDVTLDCIAVSKSVATALPLCLVLHQQWMKWSAFNADLRTRPASCACVDLDTWMHMCSCCTTDSSTRTLCRSTCTGILDSVSRHTSKDSALYTEKTKRQEMGILTSKHMCNMQQTYCHGMPTVQLVLQKSSSISLGLQIRI